MYQSDLYISFSFFVLLRIIGQFCAVCGSVTRNNNLLVETNVGIIRGLRAEDGNYTMFMGIPYATVNESNIFGAAIPQAPFEDVFEAYDDSAICPQIEEFNFTTVGSLDCLHLNVYMPNSASLQNPLPVMVYIYGGGFSLGFAGRFVYGPKYLVRHDVIVVTLNYRLGPYGFMCLDTPEVPGNAGLKDQVLALRWIQNNIGSFGGDPDKVTLFGNSAGGMSNAFHLLSETEKLFSNIITQSGSGFNPRVVSQGNADAPLQLAAALNYVTDDINDALNFISQADVHSIIEVSNQIGFGPCLEKEFPEVERFLANGPLNSNHSKAADTAILLGFNRDEMLIVYSGDDGPEDWIIWELLFEENLRYMFNFNVTRFEPLSKTIRRFYLGDEEINNEKRKIVCDYHSDVSFVYPMIRSIDPYLQAGAEKVYQYLFSYDGNKNFVKLKDNITMPGVAHADEIGYLFDMQFAPDEPTEDDQLIIDRMTTMWTNFAKYRDPTPEISLLLPIKWEPITKGSPYHYINIDLNMTANMRYEPQRMSFWDLFYKSYRNYEFGFQNSHGNLPDSSACIVLSPFLSLFVLFNFVFKFYS